MELNIGQLSNVILNRFVLFVERHEMKVIDVPTPNTRTYTTHLHAFAKVEARLLILDYQFILFVLNSNINQYISIHILRK